jgi:hypothetical protein
MKAQPRKPSESEPPAERVEDGQRALGRIRAQALDLSAQPRPPALVAPAQEGHDQVVLGGEVAVERRLGDPCVGDDRVDADGRDPLAVERLRRGVEDPGPGRG